MWIGLFSDIHANREALEACLSHARGNGITRYIFLGDYVGYGADPGFAVDTVLHEVAGGLRRPGAHLAHHEHLEVGRHLVEPLRHLTQRDVPGAVDVAVVPFDRFAHVEHHDPLGQRVGDAFDGDGGDVHGPCFRWGYLRNLEVRRSASGLPPVWQVAQ